MGKINWKEMADAAAEIEDQTEVPESSGFNNLPDEGVTVGRLVEYIELGEQPQKPWKGQPKKPIDKVRITFELLTDKHIREIEVDGVTKKIANRISVIIPKALGDKAQYRKLFDAMRNNRDGIKNMAQMLGEAFKLKVVHNVSGEKTYANLKDDNGWLVYPPTIDITDENGIPTGKVKQIKVPETVGEERLFIWSMPNRQMWDSLFIDGSKEVKKDGKVTVKSNNWIQDMIKSAVNFEGSPLFDMLSGLDTDELEAAMEETEEFEAEDDEVELEEEEEEETEDEAEETEEVEEVEEVVEKPKTKAKSKTTKTTKAKSEKPAGKKKATSADEDDLAALGLI